jgi:PAS domain S-box-containing protein
MPHPADPAPTAAAASHGAEDVLRAGGEVGRDLLAVDWARTGVGPPEGWQRSLTTAVRILLTSRFAMWMAWGEDLTFFCNAAYRDDTLGKKYPWALGRSAREVWAEIWPDIGPRIDAVMSTGQATWDEALLLFLERSGYVEETYHTFSYSPLHDDEGAIAGMLCVVSEDTERVIGERHMATLRDLGSDTTTVRTEDDVIAAAVRSLENDPRSLPFALVYLFDEPGESARLAGAAGIATGTPAAPAVLATADPGAVWPVAALATGEAMLVPGIDGRLAPLPSGAWDEPPEQALVVPLPQQGQQRPYGFLVAALNRYRALDDAYRSFVGLVAGQIAAGISAARAYEAERRRAEQLAELDRAKTAFFTNISHELRTPLTLLLGPAEDALGDEREPLPADQRWRVEAVLRNAQRLLMLVNSLLDFSRLESGRATAQFEPVDLARYTTELASMFRSAFERAGLTLEVDCPPLSEPVYVDPDMWAKIVLNLLSNALKFTFEGGAAIRLREEAGAPRLVVSDTGTGIEPAEQEQLFERFHRVLGARSRSHEGTGIGLALVAELTGLHGGEVGVDSAPGRGSAFTVSLRFGRDHLPADQVAAAGSDGTRAVGRAQGFLAEAMRWLEASPDGDRPDGDRAEGAAGADGAGPASGGRARILVVDDNADMREYLSALLAGEYAVAAEGDGAAALARVRSDAPDLVLTDVMMPELDGFGLLAALRADPDTSHIPVVMLSARAGEEGTIEGLEAGADDYLVKPFTARELRARVRANLELDRARRIRDELERSGMLLDQAEELAGVGSWEIELATGAVRASAQYLRLLAIDEEQLRAAGLEGAMAYVHPDDRGRVAQSITDAVEQAVPFDVECRIVPARGPERFVRARGVVLRDEEGRPTVLRGSVQDVTEQREAEEARRIAAATAEAAARERRIADELQRSLLPALVLDPEHLEIATYYRAGVEGTQVGGDWYDVIELGAGRTALVIGDVMGRGVQAAAIMGQVRAAVRAFARLDLRPADMLELLDGVVRDLGEDQIVTCVYAIYDPIDGALAYANAGHLPPLLCAPGTPAERLSHRAPPLGSGPLHVVEHQVRVPAGGLVALYTDGLVEHRLGAVDAGIDALAAALETASGPVEPLPGAIVDALLPDGPDDDVAVLVARVPPADGGAAAASAAMAIAAEAQTVGEARAFVAAALESRGTDRTVVQRAVLLTSELVTNAVVHGRPPIQLRLRHTARHAVIEVYDGTAVLPRKLRPTPDDEHGRGLQLVASLAERWGTRPLAHGKSVWCMLALTPGP